MLRKARLRLVGCSGECWGVHLIPQDGRMTLGTAVFPDQAPLTTVVPVLRNPVAQAMQHRHAASV